MSAFKDVRHVEWCISPRLDRTASTTTTTIRRPSSALVGCRQPKPARQKPDEPQTRVVAAFQSVTAADRKRQHGRCRNAEIQAWQTNCGMLTRLPPTSAGCLVLGGSRPVALVMRQRAQGLLATFTTKRFVTSMTGAGMTLVDRASMGGARSGIMNSDTWPRPRPDKSRMALPPIDYHLTGNLRGVAYRLGTRPYNLMASLA